MIDQEKNYYELLEVHPSVGEEELYESYIRAKNTYSEDSAALYSLMSSQECKEVLELIELAYSVLSVPHKRKEYDRVKGLIGLYTEDSQRQSQRTEDSISYTGSMPQDQSSMSKVEQYSNTFTPFNERDFKMGRKEADVSKITAIKRFSLTFDENAQMEQEIESATEFSGAFLKKIREYKNVGIERMADLTRISKSYIRQIEDEEVDKLPAVAYVRGFVYQYAKCLKLNPDLVATSYITHLRENNKI